MLDTLIRYVIYYILYIWYFWKKLKFSYSVQNGILQLNYCTTNFDVSITRDRLKQLVFNIKLQGMWRSYSILKMLKGEINLVLNCKCHHWLMVIKFRIKGLLFHVLKIIMRNAEKLNLRKLINWLVKFLRNNLAHCRGNYHLIWLYCYNFCSFRTKQNYPHIHKCDNSLDTYM